MWFDFLEISDKIDEARWNSNVAVGFIILNRF